MTNLTLDEAKKRGRILAGAWDETKYPDDEWMALCSNWDINLWTDENENHMMVNYASIYPVHLNEETGYEVDTSTFYRVWENETDEKSDFY